jgi:hypothetical protein
MVLLQASKNTLIANSPFSDKKSVLKDSTFDFTRDVGKSKEWRKEDINARQKNLANWAVKTWPLP